MKIEILNDTFDIINSQNNKKDENCFILIKEELGDFLVIKGNGKYKCLKIDTTYSDLNFGILEKIAKLFSDNGISIFAFTSIDFGYFFFKENFIKKVENNILINYKN